MPLLWAAFDQVVALARRSSAGVLLPGERRELRALLLARLLPAAFEAGFARPEPGMGSSGGGDGDGDGGDGRRSRAIAVLVACACGGVAAADLPRRSLASLMAAVGPPTQLPPAAVGALLPALVAAGDRKSTR